MNVRKLAALLVVWFVFNALPAAAQITAETNHAAIARQALNQVILPGFERLADATGTLRAEADAACSGEGPIEAKPVKDAYNHVFDAWIGVEQFRFGPTEENNARFALAFWPDTKGATPRTLETMIANEDPVVDDPAGFRDVSVAARGLFALDYLLYDPDATSIEAGTYRCRLLKAIARDAATTAANILAGWRDPWADVLTSAGHEDNPVFLTPGESTKALYSALTDSLQADIDLRLGRPMGTFEHPQPRRAEAWRSGRSLRNVRQSLEALRAYTTTVFAPALPKLDAEVVDGGFDAALAAVDRVQGEPIDVAVATAQGRIRVEALQDALVRLQAEIAEHVGPPLGVTGGFNAMDGD